MVKRSTSMLLVWPLLRAGADFLVLAGAMVLAYALRFSDSFAQWVPRMHGVPPLRYYVLSALVAAAFWVLFFALRGLYRSELRPSLLREMASVIFHYYLGFALLFAFLFFYREFFYSRVVALLTLLIGTILLLLVRLLLALLRRRLFPSRPLHRALLVGPLRHAVHDRLVKLPESGLSLLLAKEDSEGGEPSASLEEQVEREQVDTVLLAYSFVDVARARDVIERLAERRLNFLFAPEPQGLLTGKPSLVNLGGLPVIRLREDPLAGWNGVLKRGFDLLISSLLLLLLSPLLLLLVLLVKLTSRGPVIYRQQRVGLDGRPFTILKFRTMRVDAEASSGPVWAKKHDPRTTALGGFLRRWSLDELPQLLNVLRGEMSLVGPRPERPGFVHDFRDMVPRYMERHRVRAGMTGWAQVNGMRGQAPIEERTRYDLYYVENWSLGFDVWILAKTMVTVLFGRDAY